MSEIRDVIDRAVADAKRVLDATPTRAGGASGGARSTATPAAFPPTSGIATPGARRSCAS